MAAGIDDRAGDLHGALDRGRDRNRFQAQLQLALRHPCDIEKVFQQVGHLRDLPVDHVAAPGHTGIVERAPAQQAHGVPDRGQGIAQLVREHGDEVVLLAVGIAQCLLGRLAIADVRGDAEVPHRPAGVVVGGVAVMVDPSRPAVATDDAQLGGQRLSSLDRLGPLAQEAGAVVGVDERDHRLPRRREGRGIDAEDGIGLRRPPQGVAPHVEIERTHPAGLERECEPFPFDRQVLVGLSTLGDVGHDADHPVRPPVGQARDDETATREKVHGAAGPDDPVVGGERIFMLCAARELAHQVPVVGVQRLLVFVVAAADPAAAPGQRQTEERHAFFRPGSRPGDEIRLPRPHPPGLERRAVACLALGQRGRGRERIDARGEHGRADVFKVLHRWVGASCAGGTRDSTE